VAKPVVKKGQKMVNFHDYIWYTVTTYLYHHRDCQHSFCELAESLCERLVSLGIIKKTSDKHYDTPHLMYWDDRWVSLEEGKEFLRTSGRVLQ
jgi:hypothetical protein